MQTSWAWAWFFKRNFVTNLQCSLQGLNLAGRNDVFFARWEKISIVIFKLYFWTFMNFKSYFHVITGIL
jgi:hypothetical protein